MSNHTTYLGRCKACDYALFATSDQITTGDDFNSVKAGEAPVRVQNAVWGRCNNRHRVFILKAVKGTYSDVHKCDARCLNAKGHECTCSCGGANHGRGYAVEITQAPAPRETPRPTGVKLATDKQANFIKSLLEQREIPATGETTAEQRTERALLILGFTDEAPRTMTLSQASNTIEWLKSLPWRA